MNEKQYGVLHKDGKIWNEGKIQSIGAQSKQNFQFLNDYDAYKDAGRFQKFGVLMVFYDTLIR